MTGRRWDLQRDRTRIANRGAESINGAGVEHGPPKPRTSKADLRTEIYRALASPGATVTKFVTCACGRRGAVRIPIARAGARLRCSTCGEVTK
jgi:hypothetical protein